MKTNITQRIRTSLLASVLLALIPGLHAATFNWDGTANTWPSSHWTNVTTATYPVAGTTITASDSATIGGGTVTFAGNDTFGNSATAASPSIIVNSNGTLASGAYFNTLWNLTLGGGTLLSSGGVNAAFGTFNLAGTVTNVAGTTSTITNGATGSYNLINLGNGTTASSTTFFVDSGGFLNIGTIVQDHYYYSGGNVKVAGSLIKTGAGTLTLGAVNTYAGATTISGGTLQVRGSGSLGSGNYAGSLTNNGTFEYSSSANQTLSGSLSGTGALTKDTGAGTLTLSGAVSYTGATTVSAGKLVVTSTHSGTGAATVGANADVIVNVSGTSQWQPASLSLANPCTLEFSNVQNPNSNTAPLAPAATMGTVSGVTVKVNSLNNTAGLAVGSAYPLLGNAGSTNGYSLGAQPFAVTGHLAVNGSGTLVYVVDTVPDIWAGTDGTNPTYWDLGTSKNWVGLATGNSPANTYAQNDPVLFSDTVATNNVVIQAAVTPAGVIFNNSLTNYTLSAGGNGGAYVIGGSGGLTMIGSGRVTLAGGAHGYSGATVINAGTLQLGNGTNGYDATLTGTSAVTNNGALIFNTFGSNSVNYAIRGTGSVTKQGAGTNTLTAANSYAGNTTVSAGQLTLAGSYTGVAAGSQFIANGNGLLTFDLGTGTATYYGDGYASAQQIANGSYTNTVTLQSGTVNVNTKTSGTTASINLGIGSATANGALIVNGGVLNVPGRILMGANNGAAHAKLTLNGGAVNMGTAGSGSYADPGLGVLWFGAGTSTVNLYGGKLALYSFYNQGKGPVTLNLSGGAIQAVNNNATFTSNSITMNISTNGVTMDPAGYAISINSPLVHDSGLSGADGGLTLTNSTGTGTLTLTGTNTYSGPTTIQAGTLALGPTAILANSASITVSNGATFDVSALYFSFTMGNSQILQGSGTVNGPVVTPASPGSIIRPGGAGGVGTLPFASDLNLGSGGSVYFDVNNASYATGNDQVTVAGTLTLSSSTAIHIVAGSTAALDTNADYVLFAVNGYTSMATTPTLTFDSPVPRNYANYSLVLNGNNVVLHYNQTTLPVVTSVTASPSTLSRGQSTTVTASVAVGTYPLSSVMLDASAVGAGTVQLVSSNGTALYTNTVTVDLGVALGVKSLVVTATDIQGNPAVNNTYVTVVPGTEIWTGAGADNNWSTVANWTNNQVPLDSDNVLFVGLTQTTNNMDGYNNLGAVIFGNTAGAFLIGSANSSMLTLSTGITNESPITQTLALPLLLNAPQTLNAAAGNLLLSGPVSDNGTAGLTVAGTNSVILSAANGYAGPTTIGANSTLVLGDPGQLGGGLYAAAIVNYGAFIDDSSADQILSGAISGTGALTKTNTSTLTLTAGASSFTGNVTVSAGTLIASGMTGGVNPIIGSLGNPQAAGRLITVGSGASLSFAANDILGNNQSTPAAVVQINGGVVKNVDAGGTTCYYNTLQNLVLTNGGSLVVFGGVNTNFQAYQLRGTVTSSGPATNSIVVADSPVNSYTGIQLGSNVPNSVTTFDVEAGPAGTGLLIAAPLTDGKATGGATPTASTNGLVKIGAGTLELDATNSYNGLTTVSNGTLLVNGSIASGGVVVAGGTLGGNGTLNGTVTVNAGGTLSPAANGVLTLNSNLVLNAWATNVFVVDGTTPANNSMALGGSATYGGVLQIVPSGTFSLGQTFTLFSGAGAASASNFATIVGSPGAGLAFSFTNGVLSVVTAPVGPTLTSVSPNPVTGSSYPVTLGLTGNGFTGATAVWLTNLTASTGASYTPTVNSDTSISVNFVPGTAASLWNATVVKGAPSSQVGFSVNPPAKVAINTASLGAAGAGKLVLSGTGGAANNSYAVVSATNLNPPVVWSAVVTNKFDSGGNFSYTNTVSAGTPQLFLRLQQ